MIEVDVSSSFTCAMAPPEQNECIENSPYSPAATAYTLTAATICGAKIGLDPLTGGPPESPDEIFGNKYFV